MYNSLNSKYQEIKSKTISFSLCSKSKNLIFDKMETTNFQSLLAKPIAMMTGSEFMELARQCGLDEKGESQQEAERVSNQRRNWVHGIKGLCELLGCSTATANRIKASGIIDKATRQVNRTILFDADLVLELIKNRKRRVRQ